MIYYIIQIIEHGAWTYQCWCRTYADALKAQQRMEYATKYGARVVVA